VLQLAHAYEQVAQEVLRVAPREAGWTCSGWVARRWSASDGGTGSPVRWSHCRQLTDRSSRRDARRSRWMSVNHQLAGKRSAPKRPVIGPFDP